MIILLAMALLVLGGAFWWLASLYHDLRAEHRLTRSDVMHIGERVCDALELQREGLQVVLDQRRHG